MERNLDDNDRESSAIERDLGQEKFESGAGGGFSQLLSDEIERVIALCEAPSLLWYRDPGEPEPFGLID